MPQPIINAVTSDNKNPHPTKASAAMLKGLWNPIPKKSIKRPNALTTAAKMERP